MMGSPCVIACLKGSWAEQSGRRHGPAEIHAAGTGQHGFPQPLSALTYGGGQPGPCRSRHAGKCEAAFWVQAKSAAFQPSHYATQLTYAELCKVVITALVFCASHPLHWMW